MLKIRNNVFPRLPEFFHATHAMKLSPVESENDELIRAIEETRARGNWADDSNDAESIEAFWGGVEEDIRNDPEWIAFADADPEE